MYLARQLWGLINGFWSWNYIVFFLSVGVYYFGILNVMHVLFVLLDQRIILINSDRVLMNLVDLWECDKMVVCVSGRLKGFTVSLNFILLFLSRSEGKICILFISLIRFEFGLLFFFLGGIPVQQSTSPPIQFDPNWFFFSSQTQKVTDRKIAWTLSFQL